MKEHVRQMARVARCDACVYWEGDAGQTGRAACVRMPPTALEGPSPFVPRAMHPLTLGYDFCGEFTTTLPSHLTVKGAK